MLRLLLRSVLDNREVCEIERFLLIYILCLFAQTRQKTIVLWADFDKILHVDTFWSNLKVYWQLNTRGQWILPKGDKFWIFYQRSPAESHRDQIWHCNTSRIVDDFWGSVASPARGTEPQSPFYISNSHSNAAWFTAAKVDMVNHLQRSITPRHKVGARQSTIFGIIFRTVCKYRFIYSDHIWHGNATGVHAPSSMKVWPHGYSCPRFLGNGSPRCATT